MEESFIRLLADVSFPIAVLVVSYLAFRELLPIVKTFLENITEVMERMQETLEQQSQVLHSISEYIKQTKVHQNDT